MDWYWYIIIGILFLAFWSCYLIVILRKRKNTKEEDEVLNNLINLLGGYKNIKEVSVNSSRLSLSLEDSSYLEKEEFINYVNTKEIGIVKQTKKVTLVIGSLANKYYEIISKNK